MDTVRGYVDRYAAERPDNVFLVAPESRNSLTYQQVRERARSIGTRLDSLGIAPGAKVAFLLNNGLWSAALFLGVTYNRRVIVPLNAVSGVTQLRYVLEHSDSEILFVSEQYRERFASILVDFPRPITVVMTDEDSGPVWPGTAAASGSDSDSVPVADDDALLLYTSGTTGRPKGALLCHSNIVAGGRYVAEAHGLTGDDRALCVLPVYHINGAMVTLMAPLVSGGSVVMPHRFSATHFWDWVAEWGCTWSSVVPTIIKYLLDRSDREPYKFGKDDRLKHFRFGRSASAPLPGVVLSQWEQTFHVPMIETLGLTETAGTVMSNPMPPRPHKVGSVGLPYGNRGKVIGPDESELPAGVVGEIVIHGDNVLDHYYKNEDATRKAFTSDGWFRTGDLAYRDDDGYFFITGRSKELIIKGGENIAPREIDDVLYQHEAVLEAAAVGIPDDNYGQEVVACVVRREGFDCTEDELIGFCANAVGNYKAPRRIYFMDTLPKGPSGKIQRLKLPELIAQIPGVQVA